jgi:xanthosine utilization system XapX-like protein
MTAINRSLLCALGISLISAGASAQTSAAQPDQYVQPTTCNADTRQDPAALSPLMPCVIPTSADGGLSTLIQESFDTFSWQSFVSLNWPAAGGEINKGPRAGGDAATVWEGWMDAFALMLSPTPPAWGTQAPTPPACADIGAKGSDKVLRMVGKTPNTLIAANQPFDTGPLIDQNGAYTWFQIVVNKPMYDFIVGNKLTTKAGQAAYVPTITPPNLTQPSMTFPRGFQTGPITQSTPVDTAPGFLGAIMLKLAYKQMGPGDDPTKFHTLPGYVYTAATDTQPASCRLTSLGLVGMHVGNKVEPFPQWVWSTFEHVRNAPSQDDVNAGKATGQYNYYNTACSAQNCAVNKPPPRPWNPAVEPFPGGYKSQVTRIIALTENYQAINKKWQSALAGGVWANYELVGTQWPTQQNNQGNPTGYPFPVYLANTTMETYTQGNVPQSSSSCIACHNNAVDTAGHQSDFTYILQLAK